MYSPQFNYTHSIVNNLMAIEKAKVIVDMLPLSAELEHTLRKQAKISMAHFSTRIEGNPLDFANKERIRNADDLILMILEGKVWI